MLSLSSVAAFRVPMGHHGGMTNGNPNYQGPFGNTLLHGAVLSGDAIEVARLLASGADPRIRNREGRTPAQVAVLIGDLRLYEMIAHPREQHLEQVLDDALAQTFPASDPIAVTPA